MSLKKTDLYRNLKLKLEGRMKGTPVPGRFAADAAALPDRKAQRKLDAAAGLVPFACKLPADVATALREKAATHEGGLNALVGELLRAGQKG